MRSRAHVAKWEKLNIFRFPISVFHYCSPCGSRAHAVEHVESPCGNRNFRSNSFRFSILVLQFWFPCGCRAHAAKCENRIPISMLHYCSYATVEHIQQNKCPLPAEIRIFDFWFQCCTFDPYAIAEHIQRNTWPLLAEIGISDFRVGIVVPYARKMDKRL